MDNALQKLLDRADARIYRTKVKGKTYCGLAYDAGDGLPEPDGEFILDHTLDIIRLLHLRHEADEIEAALTLKLLEARLGEADGTKWSVLIGEPDLAGGLLEV